MRLGMSGSRNGITKEATKTLRKFLASHDIIEAHHGDCVGADFVFHNEVSLLGIKTVIHPPTNNRLRAFCPGDEVRTKKTYLARNRDIIDETDVLIAFPSSFQEITRSGTWSTIRYARSKNKRIFIIFPDGSSQEE